MTAPYAAPRTGDYEAAAAAFARAADAASPSSALRKTLTANLSAAHEARGDFEAALKAADAAVDAAPRWSKAYLRCSLQRCTTAHGPGQGMASREFWVASSKRPIAFCSHHHCTTGVAAL